MAAKLHLAEDALALHLLLQRLEGLIDVVIADENLHAVFYRDILSAALDIRPSEGVRAIVAEVLAFDMPGSAIPGYLRKAAQLAREGIFDLRIHHDEVLQPLVRHWRIFERTGLDAAAEASRAQLATYLTDLDASATRFEERRSAHRHATVQAG